MSFQKTFRVRSASVLVGASLLSSGVGISVPASAQDAVQGARPAAQATTDIPSPAAPAAGNVAGGIADIIVTARRTNESAQTVPLAISILGPQKLKDTNVTGIADIASVTPNFFVQTSSADASGVLLTIRGQSQQDSILTTDSPIGVYVDGVNFIRSSNLGAELIDIERVEVLKGPQGTLYGKNTTGGAISITTRQPDLTELGGFGDIIVGNHGRKDFTGAINLPIVENKLAIRLLGQHTDHDSYGHNGLGAGIGDKNQDSFRANLLFTPSSDVRLAISADYSKFRSNGITDKLAFVSPFPSLAPRTPNPAPGLLEIAIGQGILNPAFLANPVANQAAIGAALTLAQQRLSANTTGGFYDNFATSPQGVSAKTYGVSINLSVDLTPDLTFRSISASRWLSRREQVDLDGSPFNILSADLQAHARNLSQELQFSSQKNHFFNWIVGGYVNEEKGNDSSNAVALATLNPANPNTTDGDVRNSSWAVFGQGVFSLTDTLRATVGARWTEEQKQLRSRNRAGPGGTICSIPVDLRQGGACVATFDNTFSDYSYLASIDWKPINQILLYGRTARGFKGGGENLRGTGNDDSFAPFKPEIVTDYELGVKSDFFDRRLRLNADIFYANYTNIQRTVVQASTTGAIVSLLTNAAKARIQGVEADIIAVPITNLTLSGSVGITDAKYNSFVDATGDRSKEPFQFPKYSYTAAVTYVIPTSIGPARLAADWNWRSRTQLVASAIYASSLSQAPYGLLGARASLTIKAIDTDVALFGKNILDKNYSVSGANFDNSLGFNTLYRGEPRTIGIQLTKRLGGG